MEISQLRNKAIIADKDVTDINMRTLVAAGEIVFCSEIDVDAIRSSIRNAEWYTITALRFGQQEPVEVHLEKSDLCVFSVVN